jgi:AcrR family transcriptional regulator
MTIASPAPDSDTAPLRPRERILQAASELFYRHGIRAVGVEAIAEAAGTNKMTLYRHFASKDELVAEYLRGFARQVTAAWDRLEAAHPGDPRGELSGWIIAMGEHLASREQRGCAFCNAAIELPERDHPARRVIEEFKTAQRRRLAKLCTAAGIADPESTTDELFLLLEGARVSVQSMGSRDIAARFVCMAQAKIAARSL